MNNSYKLLGPFKQLICLANLPLKGALGDDQIDIVPNGGLLICDDQIIDIDNYQKLTESVGEHVERISFESECICMPSFCDAHTHICFGGSRARDYALRNSGASYLEIAKAGGGIWDTVTQTRISSQEQLLDGILLRCDNLLKQGITTAEVKSGYGLSVSEELKMLRAIKEANKLTPLDLIPTCLAAHIKPKDFEGNHEDYLKYIAKDLFPILKQENLCSRIDAFIEEEAFSADIVENYFAEARKYEFDLTVHADQFSTGGSQLAVKMKALSADHLEVSGEKEIIMLADSEVIAMALPAASIGLGCSFTPARKLLDAGAAVAIASDWNPGSAPMGDLLISASVLATYEKLSNLEVLAGISFRAALALQIENIGRLKKNNKADFLIYNQNHYNEIFYHQGTIKPDQVWKSGKRLI